MQRSFVNFLLKNLEVSLDETHLLVGEKLLDEQKVTSLFESERNLWVAQVDGFETEMQISPSRVKACSCECDVFLKEKMCGHVAAGLMALRKRITQKKVKTSTAGMAGKTYQKLTVNAILDQVEKEELSAFIRHYARSNRHFSIALKTRFAGAVPMEDNAEKYRQVMDSVIKSAINKSGRVSSPGSKQILATGADFLGQATDSMALDHFVDCWSVLAVLLEKVVPILHRTDFEQEALLQLSRDTFDLLNQLVTRPVPPGLKADIWQYLLNLATRPVYRGYDQVVFIFETLLAMADDKAKALALLETVEQELKRKAALSENYHQQLIACKLSILQNRGFGTQLKSFEQEILASPEQVLFAVAAATKNGLFSLAKKIGQKGLAISDHRLFQYRLKAALLEIALREKDPQQIAKWAGDCFVSTGQLKYLRLCKQHHPGDWDQQFEQLEQAVLASKVREKNQILADLYGENKKIEKLAALSEEVGTVDFLLSIDHYFLPDFQAELKAVYIPVLDEYFSTHIGIKPTQKMMAIFAHLRQQGGQKLVDQLAAFVRKKYPHRLELALELMSL